MWYSHKQAEVGQCCFHGAIVFPFSQSITFILEVKIKTKNNGQRIKLQFFSKSWSKQVQSVFNKLTGIVNYFSRLILRP